MNFEGGRMRIEERLGRRFAIRATDGASFR